MSRFLTTIPSNTGFVNLGLVETYPTGGGGPTAYGPTSYFGSDPRPAEDGDNLNNPMQSIQKLKSSGKGTKRSVSETKKKYVASQQGWKCAGCKSVLDATFEVDHKVDLQYGGTNQVNNLHALCRNCHGKKGMMNRIR